MTVSYKGTVYEGKRGGRNRGWAGRGGTKVQTLDATQTGYLISNKTEGVTAVASVGKLTIGADVTGEVYAQGQLSILEPVTDGDTLTIGSQVYRFKDVMLQAYDVFIGADEPATKVNIVAAINLSGTEGIEYYAGTAINTLVTAAAFSTDTCLMTSKLANVASNSYVFTETFTHVSNVLNGSNVFGGSTTGVLGDTITIGSITYTFQETFVDTVNNVFAGANEAAAKVNIVAAVNASGGTPGTTHYTSQSVNAKATLGTFSGDDSVVTQTTGNVTGEVTTETFASGSNIFDAGTTGTQTTGVTLVSEVQKFWIDGDTGTFTLTYSGQTTAAISALAADLNAALIDTRLQGLSNISDVAVTGTGTEPDPFIVTYTTPAGSIDQITGSVSSLTKTIVPANRVS